MPRQNPEKTAQQIEFFETRLLTEKNPKIIRFYQQRLRELSGGAPIERVLLNPTSPPLHSFHEEAGRTTHYRGPDHRPYRGTEQAIDPAWKRIYHSHQTLTPQQFFEQSSRGPVACASEQCHQCKGYGINKAGAYCPCVYKSIARDMIKKYKEVQLQIPGKVTMHMGPTGPYCEMKMSNFTLDIELAIKVIYNRVEQMIFWRHIVGDKGHHVKWKAMIRYLNSKWATRAGLRQTTDQLYDRGIFFHMLYRMQTKLGQIALDRGLYPSGWYFSQKRMTAASIGDGRPTGGTWRRSPWLNGGHYEDFLQKFPIARDDSKGVLFNPSEHNSYERQDERQKENGKRVGAFSKRRARMLKKSKGNPAKHDAIRDNKDY